MSSARKRGAIQKANNETDQLRQRLILSEHHASLFRGIAEGLAARLDKDLAVLSAIRKTLEVANTEPNGPICDTIWHTPHETLFDYIDAHLESYNAKVTGSPALSASPRGLPG